RGRAATRRCSRRSSPSPNGSSSWGREPARPSAPSPARSGSPVSTSACTSRRTSRAASCWDGPSVWPGRAQDPTAASLLPRMHALLSSIGWPVLDRVHIGHTFAISPHGVGIALGFLFGSWWMLREGPKRGLDERNISTILFWALIGAIVGARVFYVIAHWSQFTAPQGTFVDIFKVYNGGISLLGGI